MFKDPIVEEIRNTRAKLLKKCNYDLDAFCDMANKAGEKFEKEKPELIIKRRKKIHPKKAA